MTELTLWRREAASGRPTVLLIHGLTGNSRWWESVTQHLPSDLGFVAPDLRGRGGSWELPGPYGTRRHADDLAAALTELAVAPLVVAGYSMGGWVATMLAARHPDLVSAVVAVDGGLRIEFPEGKSDAEVVEAVVGPAVAGLALRFASVEEYRAHWRAHPAVAPYPDVRVESLMYGLTGEPPELRVRAARSAVDQDGAEFLTDREVVTAAERVSVPMTLITVDHGLLDQPGGFISADVAEQAAAANPMISVRPLEGLNHYTLILGAGAPLVAAEITATVERVSSR